MAVIHVLDSETIDKIAAGEVVERPSSVVKELVENAIDAGADAITVEIKDGGIEFIRVTDNGCGMEKGQLGKAFLRHATSKIENAEDLVKVSSLGFRGEALSSIAAVSRVEVITKTSDALIGARILLEGQKEIALEEVGAPDGTTFLMKNLFFNTPVRRKFLKQPTTEGGYIMDLMEHLALSRPDISFRMIVNNQTKFHTSGNGDLKEVIYRIYGKEAASSLIPIQYEKDGIRVEGYLGKPVLVRSNRNFEIYFVNGRFVKSGVISKAIEEGYREYLMQHKFPMCVLHITMDTERVDVNVHPTKMDVRFSDAIGFGTMLVKAVNHTLRNHEMIPDASLSTEKELSSLRREEKAEKTERTHTPEPFEEKRLADFRVMEDEKYKADKTEIKDLMQNPVWNRVKTQKMTDSPSEPEENEDFFAETSEINEVDDNPPKRYSLEPEQETLRAQGQENSQENSQGQENVPGQENVQLDLFDEKILESENRAKFRMIGQVFETYWMIEYEDKLLMIDQHAAHEKVNYERLIKQYHDKSVISQHLMPPVIVEVSGKEDAVLREHEEVFEKLGFEVESFGGNEYALRSVPVDLYGCNARELFLAVLDQLAEETGFGGIRVIEEKIASMSCKAAVKGNSLLSVAEAEALIDELLTLENPYHCPHGRPTIVAMSKSEMEKKFKRIVT